MEIENISFIVQFGSQSVFFVNLYGKAKEGSGLYRVFVVSLISSLLIRFTTTNIIYIRCNNSLQLTIYTYDATINYN
jgi:hypothetical protein